jgi:hypothetical protein
MVIIERGKIKKCRKMKIYLDEEVQILIDG